MFRAARILWRLTRLVPITAPERAIRAFASAHFGWISPHQRKDHDAEP
jgi:hypothetical protein